MSIFVFFNKYYQEMRMIVCNWTAHNVNIALPKFFFEIMSTVYKNICK
jgi:hypothetical protein